MHVDHGGRKAGGAALFSRSGAHIFLAAMGAVAVLDASSLAILQSLQARPHGSLMHSCSSASHVAVQDKLKIHARAARMSSPVGLSLRVRPFLMHLTFPSLSMWDRSC